MLIKGKAGKNASLASSQQLANLVDMRNKAAAGPVGGEADDLFASQKERTGANEESQHGEPATKKRKCLRQGMYTVPFDLDGTAVEFLMQGTRPLRPDLLVKKDSSMLAAVFGYLAGR